MKLGYKLVGIGTVWIALTFLALYGVHIYLIHSVLYSFLVSVGILCIFYQLIIKRIEKLNHDLTAINYDAASLNTLDEEGNDEIGSIAKKINQLLSRSFISRQNLESLVKERTLDLEKSNIELQKEIAEHKVIEKTLSTHKEYLLRLAHYDNLTSLPNRVFFNELLNKTIKNSKKHKKQFAILYINLDNFKNVNNRYGHYIGDVVLKEVAKRIQTALEPDNTLARIDGDEFSILLSEISHPKYPTPVVEKILKLILEPFMINPHEIYLSASIGICTYPDNGASLEEITQNVEMALFKAKRLGGGVYQYYTQEMNLEILRQNELKKALQKAIENNELVLYCQPKYSLVDGEVRSVEALIHWENNELGLITPLKFLRLAELSGLITQIDEWAINEAARINKEWQEQGYEPITIAVNISSTLFNSHHLAEYIKSALLKTGLEAKYLEIEITETTIMNSISIADATLREIKNMGVGISIDNFGTGYTSIHQLDQFPVSTLKIDKSFIHGAPENKHNVSIIKAVIALGHSLDMKVVAVGAETVEEIRFLAEQDCDMVQGYYFSPPLPLNKVTFQLKKIGEKPKAILHPAPVEAVTQDENISESKHY